MENTSSSSLQNNKRNRQDSYQTHLEIQQTKLERKKSHETFNVDKNKSSIAAISREYSAWMATNKNRALLEGYQRDLQSYLGGSFSSSDGKEICKEICKELKKQANIISDYIDFSLENIKSTPQFDVIQPFYNRIVKTLNNNKTFFDRIEEDKSSIGKEEFEAIKSYQEDIYSSLD